jgi:O-antigen ligase/tetratricopeptide (TPR) repeat protein
MSVISSVFLVLALVLAVTIGPQTRSWTWGPAMIALSLATLTSLPLIWMRKKAPLPLGLVALAVATVGWFAVRAAVSPVPEFGLADLLLLASAVASFFVIRAIEGNGVAERILSWGFALLLLASVVVAGIQFYHPEFTPIFNSRGVKLPSGFYGHYNEGANFVIAATLLVAGAVLFGKHAAATRIFFGLLVIAGFVVVFISRSRGGILGASIGLGALAMISIVIAKRQNSRWFARAIIALPIIGTAVVALLLTGWQGAQQARFGSADALSLLDNDIRLFMAGIAVSCIGLHPWEGGGSRSYSWECYRFWDSSSHGYGQAKPDLVHNELLQATTDYGLLGVGLLLTFSIAIISTSIVRAGTSDPADRSNSNAWRIGGLAAFLGVFTQSNFSFVFHIFPQTILLGVFFGLAARSSSQLSVENASQLASKLLVTGVAVLCFAALGFYGMKGTQVTMALWPTMFSKTLLTSSAARIDGLSLAIRIWPQSLFYQDRATLYTEVAKDSEADWSKTDEIKRAVRDYSAARVLHPYDPAITLNEALLFSGLQRDLEAEDSFRKTIYLQGGMESLFAGHYHFANHLFQKGMREYLGGDPSKSILTLEQAQSEIEAASAKMPNKGAPLRVAIHESLGAAVEGTQDYERALEIYNFAVTILGGQTAHYRAGALLGKMAVQAWTERRPSDALALFIEARKRATAHGGLPTGVTNAQRTEYLAYLDKTIKFLEGARIVPTPPK